MGSERALLVIRLLRGATELGADVSANLAATAAEGGNSQLFTGAMACAALFIGAKTALGASQEKQAQQRVEERLRARFAESQDLQKTITALAAEQDMHELVSQERADKLLALLACQEDRLAELVAGDDDLRSQLQGLDEWLREWCVQQKLDLDELQRHIDEFGDENRTSHTRQDDAHQRIEKYLNDIKAWLASIPEHVDEHLARRYREGTQQSLRVGDSLSTSSSFATAIKACVLTAVRESLGSEGTAVTPIAPERLDICGDVDAASLTPPPLVPPLCERAAAVQDIHGRLRQARWVSLRGDSGAGKTQLTALVARAHEGRVLWLRLRNLDGNQAAARMDAALRLLSADDQQRSGRVLVVLDDVPRFDAADALGNCVLRVTQSTSEWDVSLLSTGPQHPPAPLRELLGDRLQPVDCPAFNDQDVGELLIAYGGPATLATSGNVRFIRTIAHGHPVLTVAAVRYLRDRKWQFTNAEMEALLGGQHAKPIAGETIDRLLATVRDNDARGLLYRLTLTIGRFTAEDVIAVAGVEPGIQRALECLHALTGLWVQQDSGDQYSISPLVKALPVGNLTPATRRSVHVALGGRILKRRVLDPWHLMAAITHFQGAGQHNVSAWLLLEGLQAVLEKDDLGEAGPLLLVWASTAMPSEVAGALQAFVRARQYQALLRFGLSVDHARTSLANLVDVLPDEECWGFLGIFGSAGSGICELDPALATRILLRIVRSSSKWKAPDGRSVTLPGGLRPEVLLWMTVGALRTRDQIRGWLDTVRQLGPESRQALFTDELAEDTCVILADRLWIEEHAKAKDKRNWADVLSGLDEIVVAAGEFGSVYLKACAVRSKIVVVAEYCDELPRAVLLAEESLPIVRDDPRANVLILDCVAQQYLFKGLLAESRDWFTLALQNKTDRLKWRRVSLLIHASRAFGDVDADTGVRYAEESVALANTLPDFAERMKVQVLGELSIARWLAGNMRGAFDALDGAADVLISSPDRDNHWKGLFMCLGHVCGYLSSLAQTGRAPEATRDGGPWVAPERGMFFRDQERAASFYVERQAVGIFVRLTLFADASEHDAVSDRWAQRGLKVAREARVPVVVGTLSQLAIVGQITCARYRDALDLGIEAGRCMVALSQRPEPSATTVWEDFDPNSLLGEGDSALRVQAERHGAESVLLPAAIHLATSLVARSGDVATPVRALNGHIAEIAESSPYRDCWLSLAEVLDRSFLQRPSSAEVFSFGQDSKENLVRQLAYFGASVQNDAHLVNAVVAHICVLYSYAGSLAAVAGVERRVVLPFLEAFWRRALDHERFRFSAPSQIAGRLDAASKVPVGKRTQHILRTIAAGLRIRVPEYARGWLCGAG